MKQCILVHCLRRVVHRSYLAQNRGTHALMCFSMGFSVTRFFNGFHFFHPSPKGVEISEGWFALTKCNSRADIDIKKCKRSPFFLANESIFAFCANRYESVRFGGV